MFNRANEIELMGINFVTKNVKFFYADCRPKKRRRFTLAQ